MAPKDLDKLAKMCRKHGIISFKTAQVELSFSVEAVALPKPKETSTSDSIQSKEPFTEEDALFWSSAGPSDNQ